MAVSRSAIYGETFDIGPQSEFNNRFSAKSSMSLTFNFKVKLLESRFMLQLQISWS